MPKFVFHLTNGKTLVLEGATQPTDAEVEAEAKRAGVTLQPAESSAPTVKPLRGTTAEQMQQADMRDALASFPKGVVNGIAGSIRAVPHQLYGIGKELWDTAADTKNVVMGDTPGASGRAWENLKSIPGKAYHAVTSGVTDTVTSSLKQAHDDPSKFGESVGEQVGGLVPPVAVGQIPIPAIAQKFGGAASALGKGTKFTAGMVGAHQTLSGNPAGPLIIAAPHIVEAGGKALARWGTEAGAAMAAPEGEAWKLQHELTTGARPAADIAADIKTRQQALITQAEKLKLPTERDALKKQYDTLDDLRKQAEHTAAPSGAPGIDLEAIEKRNAAIAARQGGTRLTPPAPAVAPATASVQDAIENATTAKTRPLPTGFSDDAETEAFKARMLAKQAAAKAKVAPPALTVAPTPPTPAAATPRVSTAAPPADPLEDLVNRLHGEDTPLPGNGTYKDPGGPPAAPVVTPAPQPGISIAGLDAPAPAAASPLQQEMLNQAKGGGIRATKSKNKYPLSENDVPKLLDLARQHPEASLEELNVLLEPLRAEGSATHRTNAGLDTGFRKATDLDK